MICKYPPIYSSASTYNSTFGTKGLKRYFIDSEATATTLSLPCCFIGVEPSCSLANVALRQQWPSISSITRHRIRHCDSLQWLWNTRNHCNLIKIYFEVGKMSTDYLMGKYLGHRVSTYALMGKFPGHSMYVLFAFIYHIPAQQNWVLSLINSRQGPAQVFRLTTTANGLLQLYNKIQFFDHGEWWDLRETISVRRLGR